MDRLDQAIGGPMGVGQPGDFLLENQFTRAVILQGRGNLGPGLYGGSLVDADIRYMDPDRKGGNGNDQFNELFPTASMNVPFADQPTHVSIVADGSGGEPAIVRVDSATTPFLSMLNAMWGIVGQPESWMTTDYILAPDSPWITIKSTVRFQEAEPAVVESVDYSYDGLDVIGRAIVDGVAMGDFYLSGGNLDVFAPTIGFDEDGAVFEVTASGSNIFVEPFQFPFLAAVGDGVSYGIAPKDGDGYVPLFTASQTVLVGGSRVGNATGPRFFPTQAYEYERYFYVGHGDVASIVDQYLESRGLPYGEVRGYVTEDRTGIAVSDAQVLAFRAGETTPWNSFGVDVHPEDTRADGSFGGHLPPGDWELVVHREGHATSERTAVTVSEGGEADVRLLAPRPNAVNYTVRDERGQLVPAKVSFFPTDGVPHWNAQYGDGYLPDAADAISFSDDGTGTVVLPPGEYRAVASRGLEYELDISPSFRVRDGQTIQVDLAIQRSIDTAGWISADFHVHSNPSHDSGVSLPARLRTMVSEGMEFFVATDHDVITDFAPVVEDMGLEGWIQTAVGVETTTIEVGHYLGFPLQADFVADAGGAFDWTGMTPTEIIDEIRLKGQEAGFEPFTFVAHPRDGILGYFDQYGFDPYGEVSGAPKVSTPILGLTNPLLAASNISFEMDGLELFTGKRQDQARTPTGPELEGFATGEGTTMADWAQRTMQEQEDLENGVYRLGYGIEGNIDDWFTLLNLGYRHTALGNSDTHGTVDIEAGCPRNYVMSSTDQPALIDDQEIADAVREHRVVASYGPFVEFWINGEPIGSEVRADGVVEAEIQVQAPSWIDVDRVELYENGTLIQEWDVPADNPTNLRFAEVFELSPSKDSWYVVIVNGNDPMAPVFTPVEIPYIPLDEVVIDALAAVPAVSGFLSDPVPFPKVFDVIPYALTNPIWVDVGIEGFQAPGLPDWLEAPEEPAEEG